MNSIVGIRPYVSTGQLPANTQVRQLVDEAYELHRSNTEGAVSKVYPALASVPADSFGICVASGDGRVHAAGDANVEFTIMSVSKPFVFALVAHELGAQTVRERVGANATGRPFNSVAAVEESADGRTNPMVNAGALATTSLAPGDTLDAKWDFLRTGISRFAGRELALDEETYASASSTNQRNQSIAFLLRNYNRIYCDARDAVDLYTRQCSLNVTAQDLAVMGATLGCGGVNPLTNETVVDRPVCQSALAVMLTAGLYETSGDWLYDTGLPGKSGIGGGIVMVSPGKGGLGTFAPRLDSSGNSVKGQLVAKHLSQQLGLSLLSSKPHEPPTPEERLPPT